MHTCIGSYWRPRAYASTPRGVAETLGVRGGTNTGMIARNFSHMTTSMNIIANRKWHPLWALDLGKVAATLNAAVGGPTPDSRTIKESERSNDRRRRGICVDRGFAKSGMNEG